MELVAESPRLACMASTTMDVRGRQHLVVIAKASWSIPDPGGRPRPIAPVSVADADLYYGEPGQSAMRYGADLARFKPRCDVLLDACAHAAEGKPVTALGVGVQIGKWNKSIKVIGPRRWNKSLGRFTLTEPEPFVTMPLHFGHAFGGNHVRHEDGLVSSFDNNPAGVGWAEEGDLRTIDGQPAPNLEHFHDPITRPNGSHAPAAFSAIARHWLPRAALAGTYDERWQRDVFPFLPEDYDECFEQCAPEDQRIDYPQGGEVVRLVHLVAGRPDLRFTLPALDNVKVRILRRDYSIEEPPTVVDTLFFETEVRRFTAVWRASTPIRRRIHEFDTVAVGPIDAQWWRNKTLGIDSECRGCTEVPA